MIKLLCTIIQFVLLIDNTKERNTAQAINACKVIAKTIKSPLFKTIGNTIKNPIVKTYVYTINKSASMFCRNKNTIKNLACGLQKKYLRIWSKLGSRSVNYLGGQGFKKFKYMVPWAITKSKHLFRIEGKKNVQMRGEELSLLVNKSIKQMKGKDLGSLVNTASKSKPQLPFLFAAGGLERVTQFNFKLKSFKDIDYSHETAEVTLNNIIPLGREILIPNTAKRHLTTQIWLHGLGGNAQTHERMFTHPDLNPCRTTTKIRLITAPEGPVTINQGDYMPSWFDLFNFGQTGELDFYDKFDVKRNSMLIRKVIKDEIDQFDGKSGRVYLGGFGEGSAMAQHVGLGYEQPLGGIIGLSGFKFDVSKTLETNKDVPVFLAHGTNDKTFTLKQIKKSYSENDWIKSSNVKLHEIKGMEHTINMETLDLVREFIKNKI